MKNAGFLTARQTDMIRKSIGRLYHDPFRFHQAHVVFALALYMGLTVDEINRLTVDDVRGGTSLDVGNRSIPYSPQMRLLVRQYLQYRAIKVKDHEEDYFLVSPGGLRPGANMPRGIFRALQAESRVEFTHKMLVDTFAYNLALDGAPATYIAKLCGCSYNKAMQYVRLAINDGDADQIYRQSVERRMRPVKRQGRR